MRSRASSTSSSSSSSSSSSRSSSSSSSSSSSRSVTPINREKSVTPQDKQPEIQISDSPSILNNIETTPARRVPVVNYHVSPINSGESEVDLSDNDPTYNQGSRPRLSSTTSLSSATETIAEVSTSKKLTRKRKADPTRWKQNQQKIKRNLGEAYTSTNTKKQVLAREMKPPCNYAKPKWRHIFHLLQIKIEQLQFYNDRTGTIEKK
ncbi:uncharacterized protein LOC132904160 [Amyelois transitella]|uniref:uncharacterized protein LOC132904160 n=1 Tax=Amyelois transitella TaxID=680683 RepID=UPI00298F51A7|nr:uncharacterized protein LOC132904160 [Amyelois transitella]